MVENQTVVQVTEAFRCRGCNTRADIIERDGRLDGVACPSCSVRIDGVDAHQMVRDLRLIYAEQKRVNSVVAFSESISWALYR